jgi:hypothetical protein
LTTPSSITHTGGLRKRKDSFTNYSNNKAAATAPSPHTDVASLLPALPVGVGVVVPETVVLGEEEELVDEVDEVVLAEGALDDLEAEAEAVAAASMELIRAEGTVTPAALQNDSANCRVSVRIVREFHNLPSPPLPSPDVPKKIKQTKLTLLVGRVALGQDAASDALDEAGILADTLDVSRTAAGAGQAGLRAGALFGDYRSMPIHPFQAGVFLEV